MRYLITGANGFVGEYLVEELVRRNETVIACAQYSTPVLEALGERITLLFPDITKEEQISRVILDSEPDVIFHLAAQSFPRVSWEKPVLTMEINLLGSLYILEAMRKIKKAPTLVIIGSSAEYAMHPEGLPIKEEDPMHPSSIYGVSKMAMDEVARLYAFRYDLHIVRVRPFFMIGPRKENDFCSDVAKEVTLVEKGMKESVRIGNLRVVRDFVDIRDSIQALILLSEKGQKGEVYNLCSGQGTVLSSVLETYKKLAKVEVREYVDPNLLRSLDEQIKVGCPDKLFALGWQVQYDIQDTLADILNYWRCKL